MNIELIIIALYQGGNGRGTGGGNGGGGGRGNGGGRGPGGPVGGIGGISLSSYIMMEGRAGR